MDKTEDLGCLANGARLYRKPNCVGGFTYFSDEVGGGVMVWDTCLVDEGTLLAAMACEHHRMNSDLSPEMAREQAGAWEGSFVPQSLLELLPISPECGD